MTVITIKSKHRPKISEADMVRVLQATHALTELNASSEAGEAWLALIETVVIEARRTPTKWIHDVILAALLENDIPVGTILQEHKEKQ